MSIFLIVAAALSGGDRANNVELDYAPNELAYQALVQGDLRAAGQQLEASRLENRNDPAWLLNYGQWLVRSGRVNEANAVFRHVANAPDTDIVLASGEVVGSQEVSRRAMRSLRANSLAAR